eukprot:s4695_g1.t2
MEDINPGRHRESCKEQLSFVSRFGAVFCRVAFVSCSPCSPTIPSNKKPPSCYGHHNIVTSSDARQSDTPDCVPAEVTVVSLRLSRSLRFYSTILPVLGQYVVRPWLHSIGLEEKTGEELTQEMDDWGSKKLQETLLGLGGFYVKTGQVLSTRVDLFSKPYTDRLRVLQDSLPPVDATEIRDTVSKELCGGGGLSELLREFDDEPLGTASIAQVHRAVLNDGREVAVKVLRPNMEPVLRGDIANLKVFALAARGRLPVDYYPVFCELERALDGELDFLNEAQSARKDPWSVSDLSNSLPIVQSPQSSTPSMKPRPKQKVVRPEASLLPLQPLQDQSVWSSRRPVVVCSRRAVPSRTDFAGLWFCFETEGDMDALLVSLEVSWAKRCAASAISYGAGYVSRKITQSGDDIEMEVIGTPSDFTQRFRVGAGWQRAAGPDGDCWVHPTWQGKALRVDQMDEDGDAVVIGHQLLPWGLLITMWQRFIHEPMSFVSTICLVGLTCQRVGFTARDLCCSADQFVAASIRHDPLGRELDSPLVVPQPIPGMATRRVLVMDFIKGTPLSKLEERAKELGIDLGSKAGKVLGGRILEALTTAYGNMIFSSGFIHGDPHPGNIFVMEGGRVALIDCGQVCQLYREQRLLVAEAILAAAAYDGSRSMIQTLANCVRNFGVTFFQGQEDEDACAASVALYLFGDKDVEFPGGYSKEEFSDKSPLRQLCSFPSELVLLGRALPTQICLLHVLT